MAATIKRCGTSTNFTNQVHQGKRQTTNGSNYQKMLHPNEKEGKKTKEKIEQGRS